jgi:sporulation protein YlmC with PRC-barrel domain
VRANELIGLAVADSAGHLLGRVIDVRVRRHTTDAGRTALTVEGLLVNRRAHHTFLGYERTGVDRPALIADLLRWRQRGIVLVPWQDIETIGAVVMLRAGARPRSPRLGD